MRVVSNADSDIIEVPLHSRQSEVHCPLSEHDRSIPKPPPSVDESLIINTRITQLEKEEKEYKRRQLRTNNLMALFTGLLFLTSVVSDIILIRQTAASKQSADAATKAAQIASDTLEELRKGGTDTHDLALAAKTQADSTREIATRAGEQSVNLAKSADGAKAAAKTAEDTLRLTTRADISIESFLLTNPPIEVGKTVMLEVTLRNTGRFTAKRFVIDSIAELRNSAPVAVSREGQRHGGPMDIPEGTRKVVIDAGRFSAIDGEFGLPPKESLYIYGTFSYFDGYADERDIFCAIYLPAAVPRMGLCGSPE